MRRILGPLNPRAITNFRGALVNRTTNLSVSSGTGADISFDTTTYDTDDIHSTSINPERLTVPSGVSRIRLRGQASYTDNTTTGWRQLDIKRLNGSTFVGQGRAITGSSGTTSSMSLSVETPVFDVTFGDYFQLNFNHNLGGTVTVIGSILTWFYMEIIE